MKVESVKKAEKRADRLVVSFDSGDEIKVSAVQIADFGIYSGREFSQEEFGALRNAVGLASAKVRALRILGNRNISAREMEKRLTEKGETAETAAAAVEWLTENGMINDAEYASSIVSHYTQRGYGPARVKDELFKRGIPRGISEEVMSGLDPVAGEDAAVVFIQKKLKGGREKDDIRSVTDALCRRGYSYEDARSAVRKYIETIEEDGG